MNTNILNLCSYELTPKIRNKRFLSLIYENLINEGSLSRLENHSEFPRSLFEELLKNYSFETLKIEKVLDSKDKTHKFLFRLLDGSLIESVAIPFYAKYTICLSSQVGCAMKCSFCYTGDHGFKRNLEPYEIVGQYLQVWSFLKKLYNHKKTPNIVFMGQGEPLKNLKAVSKAIDIFLDAPGLKLGPKQITLSTVGVHDELQNMFKLPPINLAVSLHSAKNGARDKLIPSNKKLGIEKLFEWIDSK